MNMRNHEESVGKSSPKRGTLAEILLGQSFYISKGQDISHKTNG